MFEFTSRRAVCALIAPPLMAAAVLAACQSTGRTAPERTPDSIVPSPAASSKAPEGKPVANPPKTPEEAQEAIHAYLRRTLQGLPEGFVLDSSRFGGLGGNLTVCGDGPEPPEASPSTYDNLRILTSASETDYTAIILKVGDIWRSWGWPVQESPSSAFSKPNRFTRTPDGYRLNIEASPSGDPKHPPSITATSPCFTTNILEYRALPEPGVLARDPAQDTPPITPTTR